MISFIEKFLDSFTTLDCILLVVVLLLGILDTIMTVIHYRQPKTDQPIDVDITIVNKDTNKKCNGNADNLDSE